MPKSVRCNLVMVKIFMLMASKWWPQAGHSLCRFIVRVGYWLHARSDPCNLGSVCFSDEPLWFSFPDSAVIVRHDALHQNSSDILITHSKAAPVYLQATGLQQSVSPRGIKPPCLWSHSEVTGRHFKLIPLGWQFIWRDSDLQWKKQVGTNSSAANQCEEYLRAILD